MLSNPTRRPPAARNKPLRIFISSTARDLQDHRAAVADALHRMGQQAVAMEWFGADPDTPVAVCTSRAASADALVVILAHRYGWVPGADEGGDGKRSITWLEVAAAEEAGVPVFAFLVDPEAPWTQEKEQDRLLQVAGDPVKAAEVVAAVAGLTAFRECLGEGRVRETFSGPEELAMKVATSLSSWLQEQQGGAAAPVGGGAVHAEGTGAMAVGPEGIHVGGSVQGSVVVAGGTNVTVNVQETDRDPTGATGDASGTRDSLRRAYLHRVFARARKLSLSAIDPKAATDPEAGALQLDAVYTALMTHSEEEIEGVEGPGRMARQERARRLSALDMLDRNERLVLLGEPGSGKSTFVNFVAMCLAGEALGREEANLGVLTTPLPGKKEGSGDDLQPQTWPHGAPLPVCVVLRDFAARGLPGKGEKATADHLTAFLREELGPHRTFGDPLCEALLHEPCMLLLDGLDEVPEADDQRVRIKDAVSDFADAHPGCRIVVTSRTYAYQKQAWRLSGFPTAVLDRFDQAQVDAFVDRWYAHKAELQDQGQEHAQGQATLLKQAIARNARLRVLAGRPLLLTLMASLHAWRQGALPEKRAELYEEAVDLLLHMWERRKAAVGADGDLRTAQPCLVEWLQTDRDEMRGLLDRLAYQAHASQPELVGTADVREQDLVDGMLQLTDNPEVRPKLLVEFLRDRAGLLLPRGERVYTFPHRTLQEFLAACHLTAGEYPDNLEELIREAPERWREVVLLACARSAERLKTTGIWMAVDSLCFRESDDPAAGPADEWGAYLAGLALLESANLSEVSERNQVRLHRTVRWLVRVLGSEHLPAIERIRAGEALGRLGDPRPEVVTAEGMEFCEVPAGPFFLGDPPREVYLPYEYQLGKYPVTQAQYRQFVDAGGYGEGRYWAEALAASRWEPGRCQSVFGWHDSPESFGLPFDLPNHPVVGITWYEAMAFTRWFDEVLRERLAPLDLHAALPSEPEWEKAARGGGGDSDTPRRRYPWGDEEDANAANSEEVGAATTSVPGCFSAGKSPVGCEDLAGNTWEWLRSPWSGEPRAPDEEDAVLRRGGPHSGLILKGGSFYDDLRGVLCASRDRSGPYVRDYYAGLRLVLTPFSPPP